MWIWESEGVSDQDAEVARGCDKSDDHEPFSSVELHKADLGLRVRPEARLKASRVACGIVVPVDSRRKPLDDGDGYG